MTFSDFRLLDFVVKLREFVAAILPMTRATRQGP